MNSPPPAPSAVEQQRVREALHVVHECARQIAPRWSRFVADPRELIAIGTFALYRAAHAYHAEVKNEFEHFARGRVRSAMLDHLRAEAFHDRLQRAVENAADRHLSEYHDDELNVLIHHEEHAEARISPFLKRVLAATFAAGIDEAIRYDGEDAVAVREEYARAIDALREALRRLERDEIDVILLVYSKRMTLDEASRELGIGYNTARRRHVRALDRLHKFLDVLGVERAPLPLDLPGVGAALAANDGSGSS